MFAASKLQRSSSERTSAEITRKLGILASAERLDSIAQTADGLSNKVVVLGSVQGNLEAIEKININKQASVIGDIKAARIVTEDGAYIKGSMDTTGESSADSKDKSVIPIRG